MIERTRLIIIDRSAEVAGIERLRAEFPFLPIEVAADPTPDAVASIAAAAWRSPRSDLYRFDATMAAFDERNGALDVRTTATAAADTALQILTRYQRLVPRRSDASSTEDFARAVALHRGLFDMRKPLVRADYHHALDTWHWLLRIEPDAAAALQLAALFHDIERLISEADVRVEQRAANYQAFKDAHARGGATIAARILEQAGIAPEVVREASMLISWHERPRGAPPTLPQRALVALNDADALSFFSLSSPGFIDYFGHEHAKMKVRWTIARMSRGARTRLAGIRLRGDVAQLVSAAFAASALEVSP